MAIYKKVPADIPIAQARVFSCRLLKTKKVITAPIGVVKAKIITSLIIFAFLYRPSLRMLRRDRRGGEL